MKRLLLALFPGAENWLWRRISLLAATGTMLHVIEVAAHKGDSATLGQAVIGLLGVLGIYTGGAVTDDHLKRRSGGDQP